MKWLKRLFTISMLSAGVFWSSEAVAGGWSARFVQTDVSKLPTATEVWKDATLISIPLMAQPLVAPRPKQTSVSEVKVRAIHDGEWIAFQLTWSDPDKSMGGTLGKYSDAVALEFPAKQGGTPPPVFMGAKDNPVHVLHWRAQYQVDKEKGLPEPSDLYPNMQIDMYPMEFNDPGTVGGLSSQEREVYSPGLAAGNPQSYRKIRGVDEILAEGFGSSTVIQNAMAVGSGTWQNGQWTVIIARPLHRENGSVLLEGGDTFVGFAVWEGGKDEVGSRKSVTMTWTPLHIDVGTGQEIRHE